MTRYWPKDFNSIKLINGVCKIGETRAAIQLLRKIDGTLTEPDVVMYNTIIDCLCKHKLVPEACDLFSEMSVKGVSADVVTYNTLIYGFCIVGKLGSLMKWYWKPSTKMSVPIIYWLMHCVKKERWKKPKMCWRFETWYFYL